MAAEKGACRKRKWSKNWPFIATDEADFYFGDECCLAECRVLGVCQLERWSATRSSVHSTHSSSPHYARRTLPPADRSAQLQANGVSELTAVSRRLGRRTLAANSHRPTTQSVELRRVRRRRAVWTELAVQLVRPDARSVDRLEKRATVEACRRPSRRIRLKVCNNFTIIGLFCDSAGNTIRITRRSKLIPLP